MATETHDNPDHPRWHLADVNCIYVGIEAKRRTKRPALGDGWVVHTKCCTARAERPPCEQAPEASGPKCPYYPK